MLLTRVQSEDREIKFLASYALFAKNSKGREYNEHEGDYRTCFQKDRDRIIHSKAFRRLKGKTQVFVAHYGDHYRSRLAHTMEVAQISRDLARMLGLNEDLAETIALAHDLGHTPFGHAGQDTMNELMKDYGGFEHNEQSRRAVELLEEKKPDFPGLNLTFEVRDGLIKHRTSFDNPNSDDTLMPSLEAQIVNIADEIAYLCHDTDDGLRADILTVDSLEHLKLWKRAKANIDNNLSKHFFITAMISELMGLMIGDLAENTNRLIKENNIQNVDQVYKSDKQLAAFSPSFYDECMELKEFLYKNFYHSPGVMDYNKKGQGVISFLFDKYMDDPKLLPDDFKSKLDNEEPHILVKDYIAGMTDQFALDLYEKLNKS